MKGEISVSNFQLMGKHNIRNLMAAILACKINSVPDAAIQSGIASFKGLRHRLEYIGYHGNIHFYNDSIATIPEATIEAINALENVNTLILGGFDRGLDYSGLVSFLINSEVQSIICTGIAGQRIFNELQESNPSKTCFYAENYLQVFEYIKTNCSRDGICLLSPAAASYDMFKNFEERGNVFSELARSI